MVESETRALELAQLLTVVAEPLRREQRAAQVHVDDALPRVPDPAVHLHGGLADGAGGTCAVRLGHTPGGNRVVRLEIVDRPGCMESDAERTLHQAVRLGEQVLHGLERTDGHAVLPAIRGVRNGDVEHASHEPRRDPHS